MYASVSSPCSQAASVANHRLAKRGLGVDTAVRGAMRQCGMDGQEHGVPPGTGYRDMYSPGGTPQGYPPPLGYPPDTGISWRGTHGITDGQICHIR